MGSCRSHLGPARAGRPDRGHHRRLCVPESRTRRASRARHEHAAVRAADATAVGGAHLSLPPSSVGPRRTTRRARRSAVHDDELRFDCVFSDARRRGVQEGVCSGPGGEQVSFTVNDEAGGERDGIRAFAGLRWDPFILDARAALKTIATEQLAFTDHGAIFMDGKNVLSARRRDRLRALPRRQPARRRGGRDVDAREVQRPHRARRPARGEEHAPRAEAVRPRQPATSRFATSTTWRTASTSPRRTRARIARA